MSPSVIPLRKYSLTMWQDALETCRGSAAEKSALFIAKPLVGCLVGHSSSCSNFFHVLLCTLISHLFAEALLHRITFGFLIPSTFVWFQLFLLYSAGSRSTGVTFVLPRADVLLFFPLAQFLIPTGLFQSQLSTCHCLRSQQLWCSHYLFSKQRRSFSSSSLLSFALCNHLSKQLLANHFLNIRTGGYFVVHFCSRLIASCT